MKGSRAAKRYAKAVLDLAIEKNIAEDIKKDFVIINNTIDNNSELASFLSNPVVSSESKKESLQEIFKDSNAMTNNLINVLIQNKRIDLLNETAKSYISQYENHKGNQNAIVTTVMPLTKELEAKVLDKIKELTSNQVTIINKIDESILGGFILRVGDLEYNASVLNKLNNLKRDLILN